MTPLATELQRVAFAPYAVSLKTLLDHLTKSSSEAIHTWTVTHPCHLPHLASSLVSSLEFCPFALRVLEILAKECGIRDAILNCKQTFLEGVLKSAMSSERYFKKYSPLALSLLNYHLPDNALPPPALLGPFFLKCVEAATTSPNSEAIRNIYTLVSSGYAYLAEYLTQQQKTMLLGRLGKFLYVEEQGVVLAALATLAHFYLEDKDKRPEKVGLESVDTLSRELFSGKKTNKLLGLVCLNVVSYASGATTSSEWNERYEQVKLANVVLGAVTSEGRQAYVSSPEAGSALKNLVRKMDKLAIEGDSRLLREVMRFCIALSPAQPAAIPGCVDCVTRIVKRTLEEEASGEGMMILIDELEAILDINGGELLREILKTSFLLSTSTVTPTTTSYRNIECRTLFLKSLIKRLQQCPKIRTDVLSAIASKDIPIPIDKFWNCLSYNSGAIDCSVSEVCPKLATNMQKQLASILCELLLKASMWSSLDGSQPLDPHHAEAFLAFHASISAALVDSRCPLEQSLPSHHTSSASLTILETAATPGITMSSRNWRDRLLHELTRDAQRQHTGILTLVGEICRDLEVRCEGIEAPLRASEARCLTLQKLVDEATDRQIMLEDSLERKSSTIKRLEDEKEKLEQQLDVAFERTSESEERNCLLEEELEREKEGRRKERNGWAGERERMAREQLGALAERQATIGELEESVKGFEQQLESLTQELQSEQRESNTLRKRYESAKREIEEKVVEIQQRDKELERMARDLEERMVQLRERNEIIECLNAKVEEMNKSIREKDEAVSALETLVQVKDGNLQEKGQIIEEKAKEVELRGQEIKRLGDLAQGKDQDIIRLNDHISKLDRTLADSKLNAEALRTELEMAKESSRLEVERLTAENINSVNHLKNSHEKELLLLRAQLQRSRDEWSNEREELMVEIRGWERKFLRYQAFQERKAREFYDAQELAKKLLNTFGAAGTEYIVDPNTELPPQLGSPVLSTLPRPARRKRLDQADRNENGEDTDIIPDSSPIKVPASKKLRLKESTNIILGDLPQIKTKLQSPSINSACKQVLGNPTGFKTVKSSTFRRKSMLLKAGRQESWSESDEADENEIPLGTETGLDGSLFKPTNQDETDLDPSGETVIFTSTPKLTVASRNAMTIGMEQQASKSEACEPGDTTIDF